MQIKDIMTPNPRYIQPDTSIQDAASLMNQLNTGSLLVGENDRLTGVITDRDIAVRGVAEGRNPSATPVSDVMSNRVLYCFEDQDAEWAANNMQKNDILRLIVLDRNKRLTGIVSHGDIAQAAKDQNLVQEVAQLAACHARPQRKAA